MPHQRLLLPPVHDFLFAHLPELVRDGPALTHVAGTYHWVGARPPSSPTEVHMADGLTTIQFHELTARRILEEVPVVIEKHADPSAPMLVTLYAGQRMFSEMLGFIESVAHTRPGATFVVLTCGCVSQDQEYFLRHGLEGGVLSHVVGVACGGSRALGLIRDAVRDDWIGPPALGSPSERSERADSLSLDA